MPQNRNRLRPKQITFFVNDKEYDLIKKKMAQMGTDNMSAYIRKMVIDGYHFSKEFLSHSFLEKRCAANDKRTLLDNR